MTAAADLTCRASNVNDCRVKTPWPVTVPVPVPDGPNDDYGTVLVLVGLACAPSWARRARPRAAPGTWAYPAASKRRLTIAGHGHGHGHVYGPEGEADKE